jgi:hypothetical protein
VIPLHPHKGLIKMNMKVKMSTMINSKRRAMIKGKMRIMGIRKKATQEQNHHIQGYATTFKEMTSYLVILRKWQPLDHVLQIFMSITRLFLLLSLSR